MAGIALLFLLLNQCVHAQNLSWSSSFSPTWSSGNTTGNASNVGGTVLNCTVTASIHGSGSFVQALGNSGSQTPTVAGATFTVPGSANRLQITTDYGSNTAYTTVVLTFSALATNVSFRIVDIDKSNSTSTTYYDRVTVTGSNGATNYNATLTKYDAVTDPNFLIISGNTARVNTTSGQGGNTASDAGDQRGTVTASFGTNSIKTITIRYDNAPGSDGDPAAQAIAIGSVSFTQSTLPVTLTAFSGHRQQQDIALSWTTQQEVNAAYYTIERSSGNNNWTALGNIAATNNTGVSNYSYIDINPAGSSAWFYRLKQVDIDQHFKYSTVIRIVADNSKADIKTYPNPFINQLNVNLNSPGNQKSFIAITDISGKTVLSSTQHLYQGNNNFTIPGLDKLPGGIYYLEIKDDAGISFGRSKIIK